MEAEQMNNTELRKQTSEQLAMGNKQVLELL